MPTSARKTNTVHYLVKQDRARQPIRVMKLPINKNDAAELIFPVWQQYAKQSYNANEVGARGVFVKSLVDENSVPLDLKLSSAAETSDGQPLECNVLVRGVLSWSWQDDVSTDGVSSRSKCRSLHIDIQNMDVDVSEPSVEDIQQSLSRVDILRENTNDNITNPSFDPKLLEWLRGVSSVTQVSIDTLNFRFQNALGMDQVCSVLYRAMKTNLLGLFMQGFDVTNFDIQTIHAFHRIAIQSIHVAYYNRDVRCLRLQLDKFFCCGAKWSLQEASLSIPLLIYQMDIKVSGISALFTKTGQLEVNMRSISQLSTNGGEKRLSLKVVLRHASLVYSNGILEVYLSDPVHLVAQPIGVQPPLMHVPLPCSVQISASSLIAETGQEDRIVSMESPFFSLIPVHPFVSTIAVSFRSKKVQTRQFLQMNSVSLQCSIDTFNAFADNFSASVESASFQADRNGIFWLESLINEEKQHTHPIRLPYAQVSSANVRLFPKGLMTAFQTNIVEMNSVDGDENTTSSSLIVFLATKLMEEVHKRRNMQRDKRADVADSVAVTAGSLIYGASMATPVGAAVGAGVAVASLGVRDRIGSTVVAGKEGRGVSEHEGYRFGDFSRGLMQKFASKNQVTSESKTSVLKDKSRLASVGGMSAGAVVGSVLLGPVGLIAGSVIGSRVAKNSVSTSVTKKGEDDPDEALRGDGGFDNTEKNGRCCHNNFERWD